MNRRFSDLFSFIPGANVEIQDTQSDSGTGTTTSADSQLLLELKTKTDHLANLSWEETPLGDPFPSIDLDPDDTGSIIVSPNCFGHSDLAVPLPRNATPNGWFMASQIDNDCGDGHCETSCGSKTGVHNSNDWVNVTLDLGSPQLAGRDRKEVIGKATNAPCENIKEFQNRQFQSMPSSPIILKKCATSLEISKKSPVLNRRAKSSLHSLSTAITDLEVSPKIDKSPKIFSRKFLNKPRSQSINVPLDPLVSSPIVEMDKTFVGDISSTPRANHRSSGLYESNNSQSSRDVIYSFDSDINESMSAEPKNNKLLSNINDFADAENFVTRGLIIIESQTPLPKPTHQESSQVDENYQKFGIEFNDNFNDIIKPSQNQDDFRKFTEHFDDCKESLVMTDQVQDQCSLKSGPLDGGSSPYVSHSDSSSPSISTPVSKLKDSRQYFMNCFNLTFDHDIDGGNDKELYNAHISQDSTMSERDLKAGEATNGVESVLGSDHSSSEFGLSQIIESGVVFDSQEGDRQQIDEDTTVEDAESTWLEGADGDEIDGDGAMEEFRRPLPASRQEAMQANSAESQRSGSKRMSFVPGGLASRLCSSIRRLNADWMLWMHQQCPVGPLGNEAATQYASTANHRTEMFNGTVADICFERPFIKLEMKETGSSETKILLILNCHNHDSSASPLPSVSSKVTIYEPCSSINVVDNDQSWCLFICPKFLKWN